MSRSKSALILGAVSLVITSLGGAGALVYARSEPPGAPSFVAPSASSSLPVFAPRASSSARVSAPPPKVVPADPPPSPSAHVTAVVVRTADGKIRVTAGRPGYVLMLRAGAVRVAAEGTASILLDDLKKQAEEPLTLDALDLRAALPSFERYVVHISTGEGAEIGATTAFVGAPAPVATLEGKLHRCAAYSDGAGGFSALCRLKSGAWRVGAANITGADPAEDIWIMDGRSLKAGSVDPSTGLARVDTFVRLDVPLVLGSVEGRILSYMQGGTGVVLRAEASRLPGEEPSILLAASSRAQPVTFSMPMPPSRRMRPIALDLAF